MSRTTQLALLTVFLSGMFLSSCRQDTPHSIVPDGVEFRVGDIVLRLGTGVTSRAVTMADGGSDYSHCGIVTDSCGTLMIVHAVPDEPDFEGDPDRVKREPIAHFFSSLNATRGCLLRPCDSVAARRSADRANALYRRRLLFNHDYNSQDTTRMYCAQLVDYVYAQSGVQLLDTCRHNFSFPGKHFTDVILPADFLRSGQLRQIAHF